MASIGSKTGTEKAKGGITRRSIRDGEITGPKLHDDVASGKYLRYFGAGQPFLFLADMTAVASGLDTVEHIAVLPGTGHHLHYFPIANATALGPLAHADGLKVSLDATAAEGAQYVPGGLLGPWLMTVERTAGLTPDKGRFIRARFKLTDVSGAGSLAVGFRKSEGVQVDPQNYDEAAFIQVIVGTVNSVRILNTTPTVLDSTQDWADNETHEIEIRVGGSGIAKFLFDGKDLTVGPPQFQFDDAEVIVPFFDYINEAGSTSLAHLVKLEVGTLEHV